MPRPSRKLFLDEILRNGTTTASVYCTVHPQSVEALFAASKARGLRMAAGKSMMDRNAPPGLMDTPQARLRRERGPHCPLAWPRSDDLCRHAALLGDLERCADGSDGRALERRIPTTLMQTHISENLREIESGRRPVPNLARLSRHLRARRAHRTRCELRPRDPSQAARDRPACAKAGSGISHCPTSNLFIGSGLDRSCRVCVSLKRPISGRVRHRRRRRVLVLDAGDHAGGLRDRAVARQQPAPDPRLLAGDDGRRCTCCGWATRLATSRLAAKPISSSSIYSPRPRSHSARSPHRYDCGLRFSSR